MAYKNPIIPGFYPDPSVCRVGEDFYLVNSSFEYFPGVPIWHSRDLVNWRQIGNVLSRESQLPLYGCACSDGIYAATIRYNAGVFYMITTLVKSGEYLNFYVTATNPAGPWSERVIYDQSGIDPSLFFDDDGRVYFQSNRGMTFKMARAIYQSEIDVNTGRRLCEPKLLWPGTGGCYVEAPHLYKKNGWYYLMAAEGGTAYGHMVTIARSRSVWGPFESCPHNPILSNRHAYEELHGTGHGDLIEAPGGSWWMVHLAFRKTVGDVHTIGRETCLAPVTWMDDWPVVNGDGTNKELVDVPVLPQQLWPTVADDFAGVELPFNWMYLRNPKASNYSLSERKGYLRLHGAAETLGEIASPTLVARRQQHFDFQAETRLEFDPLNENEEAGLTLLMTNEHHYDFHITRKNGQRMLLVKYTLETIRQTAAEIPLMEGAVDLRISGTRAYYHFSFAQRDGIFGEIAKVNTRYLATEVTGGYNGVVIGLYATGNGEACAANADFCGFKYLPGNH